MYNTIKDNIKTKRFLLIKREGNEREICDVFMYLVFKRSFI